MALTDPTPSHSHQTSHLSSLTSDTLSNASPFAADSLLSLSTPSISVDSAPVSRIRLPSSSSDSLNHRHRQSILSVSTSSVKGNRTGLLSLAALARDKTSNAIANFADPTLRSRSSLSSLSSKQATSTPSSAVIPTLPKLNRTGSFQDEDSTSVRPSISHMSKHSSNLSLASTITRFDSPGGLSAPRQRQSLLQTNPPSQSYESTSSDTPLPTTVQLRTNYNKMHQTSSRLLRMTDDERPFTRDFKDLFSTLVVSLPLASHRIRLTRIDHSFMSEEAINNLGSLKFSQSNRMPDPKDPSRIVTTTTTTTFSMAREMARSVCQRFLDARFIESADGKQAREFAMKGATWQLTPKGIHVLERFCSRNGIQQKHVSDLLASPRNTMQLVILERDTSTDKLAADRSTIEVIFRRFIGQNGPNIKNSATSADSDSLSEYKDGLLGVKMASERKIGSPPRTVFQTFTGRAATDWLMDCCTTIDRRETTEICALFIEQELMWCVQTDRGHVNQYPQDAKFQPTKNAFYQMTQKGKDVLNHTQQRISNGDEPATPRAGVSRDSNTQKLDKILNDAALRLLFRENLRDTHCEENLSFYLDVDEFLGACKSAIKSLPSSRSVKVSGQGLEAIKETMASAYGIYNAFLAPGSPCELNIDHMLRNQLATRMTKSVGQDAAMVESLREVTKLFEEAQISVFKLMASDSVPKFMKSPKYEQTLRNYDFDSLSSTTQARQPERSVSKAAR